MKWFAIFIILFQCGTVFAQKEDDVSFLIRNIKNAYIGYHLKTTDKKYDKYIRQIERKYEGDTFRILSALADYFRDPHMKVYGEKDIKIDSVLFAKQLKEVNDYMSNPSIRKKKYEGYWMDENKSTVIALQASDGKPWHYKSFIIQSNTLPLGFVNMKMGAREGNKYETDYTSLSKGIHVFFPSEFRSDSFFVVGYASRWKKLKEFDGQPLLSNTMMRDDRAMGHLLDSNNYLIVLPANSEENVKIMDSLVKADYGIIQSTKNLIIDIRDNGGGTVRAYKPLTSFVYTNPIQTIVGDKFYSKILCDIEEQDLINYKKENPLDTGLIHLREGWIEENKTKMGKIVFDSGKVIQYDSVKRYPENVAILANYGSMSAAEMMIYDYKQSKKSDCFR